MSVLGFDPSEIFRLNKEKLAQRYPDGFSAEASNNRKE